MTILGVRGYHLDLMPLYTHPGDKETRIVGHPPPPPRPTWAKPPPAPFRYILQPLAKMKIEARARWKSHFSL